jgi:hypothetical protein
MIRNVESKSTGFSFFFYKKREGIWPLGKQKIADKSSILKPISQKSVMRQ